MLRLGTAITPVRPARTAASDTIESVDIVSVSVAAWLSPEDTPSLAGEPITASRGFARSNV